MAEHLHGYPQCAGPAGQPCPPSDLNYVECESRGALVSCTQSVVDGMPTGQYNCTHRDAQGAARAKTAKAKAKPKPKAKAKSKPKKAAKKAKKAARKPAKKAKAKSKKKAGKKKGGAKKKK